jgi:hypothetical protein
MSASLLDIVQNTAILERLTQEHLEQIAAIDSLLPDQPERNIQTFC